MIFAKLSNVIFSSKFDETGRLNFLKDGTPTSNRSSIRGFHQYQRMCVPPSILSSDNMIPSHYVYPSAMDTPPSPSNSNSPVSSLTNHVDVVGYTNRISLNCNPHGDDEKYMSKFQHRGLTTISEESNINMIDALERASVRSEKSASSHY